MSAKFKAVSSVYTCTLTLTFLVGMVAEANKASAFTIFTDRASWEAEVSSFTTETFNSFTSDTSVTEETVFSGFSITSNEGTVSGATRADLLVDVPSFAYNPGTADIDSSARLNIGGLSNTRTINLDFDSSINAFGFDTVNYDIDDDRLEVLINGTDILGLFPELRDGTGFIGVVSSDDIDFAQLRVLSGDGVTFNALDNVSIGPAAVPEPTSVIGLLALGALGGATSLKGKQKEKK
ncbi:MAG: PEP-CTERM sorting domain-containing protein [Cyanobacteria bacterium P01_G01_bin.49]